MRRSLSQLFAVPLLIGITSIVGLVAALTGDGLRNWISWVALGVPVCIVCRAWSRRG